MLFDKTYFEESNINQKPLIWSQDKIIPKFRQKNQRDWFLKSVQKLPKSQGKVLFYDTYFAKNIINQKPPIWTKDKIITKYDKKMDEFGFGQSVRKLHENL